MPTNTRLAELRDELEVTFLVFGIPLMPSMYSESSVSGPGGGWQYRANVREFQYDSNEVEVIADIECLAHSTTAGAEDTWLQITWALQDAFANPKYWEGRDSVKSLFEDEVPTISGVTVSGAVFTWSVKVAVILEP